MSVLEVVLLHIVILACGIALFGKCLMYFGESSDSPLMKTLATFLIIVFITLSFVLVVLWDKLSFIH